MWLVPYLGSIYSKEQMSEDRRLDHKVLEEAQNYKDQLDRLDIKTLWEELDKLVPEDQTHKTHTTLPG
jgi:gentisate 1,2-dioxygenase